MYQSLPQTNPQYVKKMLIPLGLVFFTVFVGDVVLWQFVCLNFLLIRIISFLHPSDRSGLKQVPFFNQLVNAFRVCLLAARQAFKLL
jgi:hypothetical protein